jgi:hypothetical protein
MDLISTLEAMPTVHRDSIFYELEQWRLGVGAERMKPNPDHDPSAAPKKKKKANRADH